MSIARNTAFNLIGSVAPMIVSLLTIPIYLDLIGDTRYGILAIVWLLLGYLTLMDLGLGRATAQRIGGLNDGTSRERATVFWSALFANLTVGIGAGLVAFVVSYFVFDLFITLDPETRPEIVGSLPWLAMCLPVMTVSGVLSGALMGRERFLDLNVISVMGAVLFQLGPLIVVMVWGPDLRYIIPSVLCARLLTMIALFNRCVKHVCSGEEVHFQCNEAWRLLRFGGWATASSLFGSTMAVLDRFIVGAMLGPASVTFYTVPFQLAERTLILSRSVSGALFPRASAMTREQRIALGINAQMGLISVMTPFSVLCILLVKPFLSVWISTEFAQDTALLAAIMVAGFWVNSLVLVPFSIIQAGGRPDLVAKVQAAEFIPYIACLWGCLVWLGLPGAALAFVIRISVEALLFALISQTFRTISAYLVAPSGVIFCAILVATLLEPGSVLWVWAAIGLMIAAFVVFWTAAPALLRRGVTSWFIGFKEKT